MAEQLIKQTQVDYSKSEEFVALSDDKGLFVISNPHRYWFPTQFYGGKWEVKMNGFVYSIEVN